MLMPKGAPGDLDPGTGLPGDHSGLREIDRRYADRPPAANYRHYFPFVAERLVQSLETEDAAVLDVGCANGAFLHFLMGRYPALRCTGIDAMAELVEAASSWVAGADFRLGNILEAESLPRSGFDAVTMLTLNSHFDSLEGWLDNLMSLVLPGGRALVFGIFNEEPCDVLVRLRPVGERDSPWLPGWNMLSRATVSRVIEERSWSFSFHDYAPPEELASSPGDPLSTRLAILNGKPILTNGAGLLLAFSLLEIRR